MRDLIVTLVVFGSLPVILSRPYVGIVMWTWLSLMNPHKLTWGFAYHFPFAQVVALALFAGMLFSKEKKTIRWELPVIILAIFWLWMFVTTIFALNPDGAWYQWDKVWKIMLLTFITISLLNTTERVRILVWVMVVSLGLYGVKGGIFTITTGGGYHVMGPAGTFIGGNNEIGLALIMTIPLMRYLQLQSKYMLVRRAWLVAMVLTFVAVIGTQSRGAFVAVTAMTLFMIMKSRHKFGFAIMVMVLFVATLSFMPESWHERMGTIETFEEDKSAMGRINAWWFAFNLAVDRPLGGGFECFRRQFFHVYAPNPRDVHDAHSIYFEVLAEHGFFGLGLFLGLGMMSFRFAGAIAREARKDAQFVWMSDLAAMVQVSIVGYAASGAFLGLAYFDYYYTMIALLVGCKTVLVTESTVFQLNNTKRRV